jgi:hypothetical protein
MTTVHRLRAWVEGVCAECPFAILEGDEYVLLQGGPEDRYVRRHAECHEAGALGLHARSGVGRVRDALGGLALPRGHSARLAWARHLWRHRRHPLAVEARTRYAEEVAWGGS